MLKIHKAVRYSDIALKHFFEVAQSKAWYDNTVFVLLADHTAQFESLQFGNDVGRYRIPMAIYSPNIIPFHDTVNVVQQLDVPGLVLERLGYNGNLKTFGNASRDRNQAIMYDDRRYQLIRKNELTQYDGDDLCTTYAIEKNTGVLVKKTADDKVMENIQLLVQKYADVLLDNSF